MKKLNVKKEILIVLMMVVFLVAISSSVMATGTITSPIRIESLGTETTSVDTTNTATIQPVTNTTTNTVVNTVTNTTVSTYQNTTLPQTGDASDYAIFAVIALTVVIAVVAYKKVRDYNI